jgi:hypothetical protein
MIWLILISCGSIDFKTFQHDSADENSYSTNDSGTESPEGEPATEPGSEPGSEPSSEPNDDNDGDGYSNQEESAAGTNPDYAYSHPYANGGYNVGNCPDIPNPTGPTGSHDVQSGGQTYTIPIYRIGDVAENFTLNDQYGQAVDLYSFCGQTVMIVFSAFW